MLMKAFWVEKLYCYVGPACLLFLERLWKHLFIEGHSGLWQILSFSSFENALVSFSFLKDLHPNEYT